MSAQQEGEVLAAAFAPNRAKPYACHNKPRPVAGAVTHLAQDGYCEPYQDGFSVWYRAPKYVEIKHTMSTDCRYIPNKPDARCAGCKHINLETV